MDAADPVAQATRSIVRAFEMRAVPYALGGALALAFWAEPRATRDLDVNVFLPESQLDDVLAALRDAGCACEDPDPVARVNARGDLVARHGAVRVDVFFPFHPFHDSVRSRIRTVQTASGPRPILSAEDLIVFKTLFNRPKDWVDVQAMRFAQGARLDVPYVLRWLTEILGTDDPRVARAREELTYPAP